MYLNSLKALFRISDNLKLKSCFGRPWCHNCRRILLVKFAFVGDFKIYYALFGISGTNSKFRYPSCYIPAEIMNVELNHLTDSHPKKTFRNSKIGSNSVGFNWKNKYTWNLLNISSNYSEKIQALPLFHVLITAN